MRVPRAFLFLALVASLTSTAYAQGAPPPVDFPVARNFHNFVPGRLGSFFSWIVGPCARARDIPSRVAPTRCICRDRDRSRRGRLGRTPIPVVQHPSPPAGPPNEPEVFQLFLTGKLFSPLTLAVSCNLARAIELNPCKADEGKELTADEKDACCKGIFTNKILLPDSNGDYPADTSQSGRTEAGKDDLWAGSGCFCISDIMNDDLPFFNAVLDIAKTCGGSYDITTIPCSSSITTSCTSGFTTDCSGVTIGTTVSNGFVGKSQAQMKADVAARPASNVPPAPDAPAAATKGAKKIQVDIRLKDATGFLGDSTAAKAKRTELETNLAKALCNECATPPFKVKLVAVSKGSTIVTAEVQPAEGSSEISAADVTTINSQTDAGLGSSPSMLARICSFTPG